MGSVSLRQNYSTMYQVAAMASWTTGPTVTIDITYNSNGDGWRIRGRNPDTREYLACSGGTWTGTFDAEDGKDYVFQVYFGAKGSYSDGQVFTVNFDNNSSGGNTGGGGGYYEPIGIGIEQGEGTELEVIRTWSDNGHYIGNGSGVMHHGEEIWYGTDVFTINAEAKDGYTIDYYTFEGKQLPFKLTNFKYTTDGRFTLLYDGNAYVSTTAKLKEYKLSASTGTGSYIIVKRTASKKSGATLGVLNNGATIYHFDTLEVTVGVDGGYDIQNTVVTGCTENSDGSFTVTGNTTVTVTTELMGLVYISDGTAGIPCLIFIDNGSDWKQCIPYIDGETSWNMCS